MSTLIGVFLIAIISMVVVALYHFLFQRKSATK